MSVSGSSAENASIERLANEVSGQVRHGKRPDASDLKDRYPELSGDVDGLVDTVSFLEEASFRRRGRRSRGFVIDARGRRQKTLGGFRLIREISRGGMGIVYEAQQQSLNRRVAVKVLPPSPLLTDVERTRFEREGTAVARLHHSNIVPIFGTGVEHGVQYCVMQYIDGSSLNTLVATVRRKLGLPLQSAGGEAAAADRYIDSGSRVVGHLLGTSKQRFFDRSLGAPSEQANDNALGESIHREQLNEIPADYWRNVARVIRDVADALRHAHGQGVLHRDIKPGNLILDCQGHVWVADFGLAKLHDNESLTAGGNVVGTLRYSSPEQLHGDADERSDLYSLGITLYELCTLERAFRATDQRELVHQIVNETPTPPRQIQSRLPRDLETIILKAIAAEPEQRYQTATEFAQDLDNFLEDRLLVARRQPVWKRIARWCRRHRVETALAAVACAMLFFSAIGASVAYFRESRLRHEATETTYRTREAIDRVYESYLPNWTTSSTVSVHGATNVSPASAQLLEELAEFYQELADRPGQGPEAILESAAARRRIGLIYHRLGEFEKSRQAYEYAKERLNQQYRQHPSDQLRLEYARVCNEIGCLYWTQRKFPESLRSHQIAITFLRGIPDRSVDRSKVQFELARTLFFSGRRARGLAGGIVSDFVVDANNVDSTIRAGQRESAVRHAISILEALSDDEPTNMEFRLLLALCYRETAELQADEEGFPADTAMRQALEALEDLHYLAPEHPGYQYELCTTLRWINLEMHPDPVAWQRTIKRLERSVDLAEQLCERRPDEWIYSAARVESLLKLATVYQRNRAFEQALVPAQQATELATEIARANPQIDVFRHWIGHSYRRQGEFLVNLERPEEAIVFLDRAVTEFEAVLDQRSIHNLSVPEQLHRIHEARVRAYEKLGEPKKAQRAWRAAQKYVD